MCMKLAELHKNQVVQQEQLMVVTSEPPSKADEIAAKVESILWKVKHQPKNGEKKRDKAIAAAFQSSTVTVVNNAIAPVNPIPTPAFIPPIPEVVVAKPVVPPSNMTWQCFGSLLTTGPPKQIEGTISIAPSVAIALQSPIYNFI